MAQDDALYTLLLDLADQYGLPRDGVRAKARAWREDLGGYPIHELGEACRVFRRQDEKGKHPTTGQILKVLSEIKRRTVWVDEQRSASGLGTTPHCTICGSSKLYDRHVRDHTIPANGVVMPITRTEVWHADTCPRLPKR